MRALAAVVGQASEELTGVDILAVGLETDRVAASKSWKWPSYPSV